MPAVRFKQYKAVVAAGTGAGAGANPQAVAPMTGQRCFLFMENTGQNPAFIQFKNPIKGDGSDLVLAVGATIQFDQIFSDGSFNGPIDAIFLGATTATTIAILEGVRENG